MGTVCRGGGTNALNARNSKGMVCVGNSLIDGGNGGLGFNDNEVSACVGNTIDTLTAADADQTQGINTTSSGRDNVIANNTVRNASGAEGISGKGERTLVQGNRVRDCDFGIRNTRDDAAIIGNYIENCTKGILAKGSGASVKSNNIYNITQWGIRAEDPTEVAIVGNTLKSVNTGGGENGVELIDNGSSGNNSIIVGNTQTGISGNFPATGYVVQTNCSVLAFANNTSAGGYDLDESEIGRMGSNVPMLKIDVRSLASIDGNTGYHDGTNSNTVGPAFYTHGQRY